MKRLIAATAQTSCKDLRAEGNQTKESIGQESPDGRSLAQSNERVNEYP